MQPITITLPDDVQLALDAYVQKAGSETNEVIEQAIRRHLFLERFQTLRQRLAPHAANQGIVSDEDVFDRVS